MGEDNDGQAAGRVYAADLPRKRDVHGQVKEWDLDPRWVTSPLRGLAHPLFDGIGRAAAGKSIDTAIPRAMLGGVANLIGIFTASDTKGRIQSGVGLAGNALGGGSKFASLATKAPTSVLAARLGAASALLGVGLTWWEAISGGGSDLWSGIQKAQRDPQFFGYYRGFATGLLGIDLPLVAKDLEHPRVYDPLTLNPGWGQDKIFEAHDRAVEKGYAEAMALPMETRLAILSEAWRFKQERNVYISPRRDEVMQAIDGFARLVPMLSAEMRDGTWDVRSEQLQVQIEAEPAPGVNGLVLNEGTDIRELAADILTQAWGHAPTDAQIQDYYEQIIEANEGALPPSSDPADVQRGAVIELPPVPDEFPTSTEEEDASGDPASRATDGGAQTGAGASSEGQAPAASSEGQATVGTTQDPGAATDRDEDGIADELEEAEGATTSDHGGATEDGGAQDGTSVGSNDSTQQGEPVEIDSDGDGEPDMTQEAQPAAFHGGASTISQQTAGIDDAADLANQALPDDGADSGGATIATGGAAVAPGSSIDEHGGTGGYIEATDGGGSLIPAYTGEANATTQQSTAPISDYNPNEAVIASDGHSATSNETGDYNPNDAAQQPDDPGIAQQASGDPATDGQANGASSEPRSDYDPNEAVTNHGGNSDYDPNASTESQQSVESPAMESDGYDYDSSAEGSQVDSTGSDGGGGGGSSEGAGAADRPVVV
jgi:hypothetical protein